MKTCSKCKKQKPKTDFHKDKHLKDGLQAWCIVCKRNYDLTSPKRLKYQREYAKKHYKNNKDYYENKRNVSRYGMTTVERKAYIIKCGSKCGACGIKEENTNRGLFIHHDHTTGKVLGVLCNRCNAAAGMLGDDVDRVFALFRYLEHLKQ